MPDWITTYEDEHGAGQPVAAPCCGRKRVARFELVRTPDRLMRRLSDAAAEVRALGIDPHPLYICGDCRQKLMGRHRAFGKKAVVSRSSMVELLGAPPDHVADVRNRQRGRWERDEV